METNQFLGILLGRRQATVVHVDGGRGPDAVNAVFTVEPDPQSDEPASLASLIGQAVARRGLLFDEAAVALESGFYSQYPLHSMFTDPRQIEGTVKYDAEEATASDAASLAVTFEILSTDENGSQLMVYSADRQSLTGILLDLQAQGIDPTIVEPDLVCLGRILERTADLHEPPESLYVVLGRRSCAVFRSQAGAASVRSRRFLLGAGESMRRELLQQIRLSIASWSQDGPVETIRIAGRPEELDPTDLAAEFSVPTERFELTVPTLETSGDNSTDPADAAAAWGAVTGLLGRGRKADFRRDFMPYQGKKRILRTCLRVISVSAAVALLAFGTYFQFKSFRMKSYASSLQDKLIAEYRAGMYGQNPPSGPESPGSRLKREFNRVKKIQEGLGPGDEKSVTAKLTFILEAVNSCDKSVDINIEQISITEKSMRILGDTNSRRSTIAFFDAVKKHPRLKIATENFNPTPSRDKFILTLDLKE